MRRFPEGVPHAVTEDDVYEGYHIPRGATIMVNAWLDFLSVSIAFAHQYAIRAILHNSKDYPEPFTFSPERFLIDSKLNQDILDPARVAFGFGRR